MPNDAFAQSLEILRPHAKEAAEVQDILATSARSAEYLEAHRSDVARASAPQSQLARGKYLYVSFHQLATAAVIRREEIDRIVEDPDFALFVFTLHEIPSRFGITRLTFHMAGTTSFIFKAYTELGHAYALKLIQAPYQRINEVRTATSAYRSSYDIESKYLPRVFESQPTWILMEFVEGERLSDYLNNLRRTETYISDRYFFYVTKLFSQLTEALSFFETRQPPIFHGDLTPLNIIVQSNDGDPTSIKLIDFGANYVLQNVNVRHGALVDAFAMAETFVAPEVLRHGGEASLAADLYSVGKIALELMGDTPLKSELVGMRLRAMWDQPAATGLAQIIEDLIDDEPDKRLLLAMQSEAGVYKDLNAKLQEQALLYNEFKEKNTDLVPSIATSLIGLSDVWKSLRYIFRMVRTQDRTYNRIGRGLFVSMAINALCQATIVTAFIIYTLADVSAKWLDGMFIPEWISLSPRGFQLGDVWSNLPGRCVAFTFGLVAARYYANIFAPLVAPSGFGWPSIWVNFVLRLNSFSYFLPIMLAIAWNPHWWPWCAFAGMFFPTLNNFLSLHLVRTIHEAAKTFSVTRFYDTQRFFDAYAEWWFQMGTYCVGVGLLGALLNLGLAVDEPIYAIAVCIINMATIYRQNCSLLAPQTQGGLGRLFYAGRRWQALKLRLNQMGTLSRAA